MSAKWFRFVAVDGDVVLINTDQHVLIRQPTDDERKLIPESSKAFVISGKLIPGDIETLAVYLNAEHFRP
jgi:hypothetical protein